MEKLNLIIGIAIIILNLIPFVLKKTEYLIVTILLSVVLAILLISDLFVVA